MPKVIAKTANMDHREWLGTRSKGVGGSDAAAIAGANPYKSPIVLYMEKVGLYKGPEPGEAAYWGNTLEAVVADEFLKRYINEHMEQFNSLGNMPKVMRQNKLFAHSEYDFMRANIDRLIVCPIRGKGILEVKTANQFLADEWVGEDVPNQYYIQLQHYLEVMDLNYGYIAVLIGGQRYKHYFIERDREVGKMLIEIESNFWNNHVLIGIPPEMDGADSTTEMMKILYPQSYDYPPLELGNGAEEWLIKLDLVKKLLDEAKEEKQTWENKLKDLIRDNEVAFAGPHKITWKTDKRGQRRFTYKLNAIKEAK